MVAETRKFVKPLERPECAAMVMGFLIDGKSSQEVVDALPAYWKVTRQAIDKFKVRHETELNEARAALIESVKDVAIKDREARIREYASLYDEVQEWKDEHGLTERTVRYDKDGEVAAETLRFNAAVVGAQRAILRDVAEEMGDISRAAKVTVANQVNVLVRSYSTPDLPD